MYVHIVVGMVIPFAVIVTFNTLLLVRIRTRTGGSAARRQDAAKSSRNRLLVSRQSNGGAKSAHPVGEVPGGGHHMMNRLNSSMTRVVMVIVVMFAVCQIPYHVMEYLMIDVIKRMMTSQTKNAPSHTVRQMFFYGNMFAQMLVFISSCSNPIIYGIFNKNYSKYTKLIILCRIFIF